MTRKLLTIASFTLLGLSAHVAAQGTMQTTTTTVRTTRQTTNRKALRRLRRAVRRHNHRVLRRERRADRRNPTLENRRALRCTLQSHPAQSPISQDPSSGTVSHHDKSWANRRQSNRLPSY